MSPGTSVDIGISCGRFMPARSTAVVDVTIALSSSAALLERNSCQKRKSVLSNTIVLRTIIVLNVRSSGAAKITSVNSETTLTVNSTPLNGVTNAWKSCWYQVGGFSCDTSLGPYCSMRASNCSSVRPVLLASSRASASSGEHAHSSASWDGWRLPLLAPEEIGRVVSSLFMARSSLFGLFSAAVQFQWPDPC